MKTVSLVEKAIIMALNLYMNRHGLHQVELARTLGWSPSDLNDILKGRKGIGKHRQAYLEEKLGTSFKRELILNINQLSRTDKKQKKQNVKSDCIVGKYNLTDAEKKYVEKLVVIFRGLNKQAKLSLQMNINALYLLSRKKQEISDKEIRVMLEEL